MSDFLKGAIKDRLRVLVIQAEQIDEVMTLKQDAEEIKARFGEAPQEEIAELVTEWMNIQAQIVRIQKEWLYVKGIQEGVQMLTYLLVEEESNRWDNKDVYEAAQRFDNVMEESRKHKSRDKAT